LLVVHGGDDHVVSLRNARQLVRQYLVFNGRLDPKEMAPDELPPPDREITQQLSPGRTATTIEYRDGARTLVRMVRVDGLGHAWSGGDATFPYNDPLPPDATALLGAFVADQIR
jgi:poly(3-hydroxybutyrate) depolymerase